VNRRSWTGLALAALPAAFLGYFFLYPLVTILATGLTAGGGGFTIGPFRRVLESSSLRGIVWFTLWQAAASTLLTLALGIPGAYVLARRRFPGRRLLRAAVTVPFVLPTVVVGTAFLSLLGPGGPLGVDLRRTVWAILIAHAFYNYAVVVRTVGTVWERLDPRLEDAARSLGAGPWRTFREVTLPMLRPAITAAASIVFLFTFTSFGVILILGDFRHATLEVEIYLRATALLDFPLAAALSVLQLAVVGALLIAYGRWQRRGIIELELRATRHTLHPPRTAGARWWLATNLAVMAVLLAAPLATLIARSLRPFGSFSLEAYRSLGERSVGALATSPWTAVVNSLRFAIPAMLLALAVGMLAAAVVAYRTGPAARAFDALLMLPLGTSAVTVGFGFLVALDSPIDLRSSPWLIPVAHALVAVPFVVRTTAPVMRAVRSRLREAAAVLGAAPGRVWREVDLPIVARAGMVGAGFAFAVSLGEFGATLFIARPEAPTLPVAIFRLLSQPGPLPFARAMAMSTILMVLTGASILAVDRFRFGTIGDF
jgi:thiamine transport system permease protein